MRTRYILAACSLACAAGSASAAEGPAVIRNEFLEVRCDRATGRVSLITLPSKRVFVFGAASHNDGKETTSIDQLPVLSAVVDLGKPPAGLRMLGTGGLHVPAKNPGS